MDELCRILDKGNKKFTDEVKKRWEDFCAKVQFYGVWKKVMKPPMNMDGGKLMKIRIVYDLTMNLIIVMFREGNQTKI